MNQPEAASVTANMRRMIRRGQLLTEHELRARAHLTFRQLEDALASHHVICLVFEGVRYYPAFYVDPQYDSRALSAVTRIMAHLPPGSILQFLLSRRGSLGALTPLEALQRGQLTEVMNAAAASAE
jgi:hypothetical protein